VPPTTIARKPDSVQDRPDSELTPALGANSSPVTAASSPDSRNAMSLIRLTGRPSRAAARVLSPTARSSRPVRVYRIHTAVPVKTTTVIASSSTELGCSVLDPIVTGSNGARLWPGSVTYPNRYPASCWMVNSTAATATRAGSSPLPERRCTGRTTASSVAAASAMVTSTAMAAAAHTPRSFCRTSQDVHRPPIIAYGPMAKLKNPAPTSTR
jgi:hypothetical protein